MKIMNLFKSTNTKKALSMPEILNGKDMDRPNVVYMATEIVGEYGAILEKTSKLIFGASEKLLPYPKPIIQDTIELLLKFLNNQNSWRNLEKKYPDVASFIITDEYYRALRTGFIQLSQFIPDEEANICEKAALIMNEPQNKGKSIDDMIDVIRSPWFEEIIQINRRIAEDSSLRLRKLQDKYGKEDVLFTK